MISVPFARSLPLPFHPVRAPHLHSLLAVPHLTTLTAVAGIHTDTALRWITGNLPAPPFTVVAIPVTHRTRGSGTGDGASECAGHEQMDCDITHVCFSVGRGCSAVHIGERQGMESTLAQKVASDLRRAI